MIRKILLFALFTVVTGFYETIEQDVTEYYDLDIEQANKLDFMFDNHREGYPWWYAYIYEIHAALWNGQIVRIKNAFENPERFDLNESLVWEDDLTPPGPGVEFNNNHLFSRKLANKCKQKKLFMDEIKKHKFFLGKVLNTEILDQHVNFFQCVKYEKDDYLENHNDKTNDRYFSIVYHTTKNWNPKCGGSLVWMGGEGVEYLNPTYNTLIFFIPTEYSMHRIVDINCGKRYSISGWLRWGKKFPVWENYFLSRNLMKYQKTENRGKVLEFEKNMHFYPFDFLDHEYRKLQMNKIF